VWFKVSGLKFELCFLLVVSFALCLELLSFNVARAFVVFDVTCALLKHSK